MDVIKIRQRPDSVPVPANSCETGPVTLSWSWTRGQLVTLGYRSTSEQSRQHVILADHEWSLCSGPDLETERVPLTSSASTFHVREYWIQCPHQEEKNWSSQADEELVTVLFRLPLLRMTSGSSSVYRLAAARTQP